MAEVQTLASLYLGCSHPFPDTDHIHKRVDGFGMTASETEKLLTSEIMHKPSLSRNREKLIVEELGRVGVPGDRQPREIVSDWWLLEVVAVV